MKTVRTRWRDELLREDQTTDENPLEVSSPLPGVIACITIAFLVVVVLICLGALSVYIAEKIEKLIW